MENPKSPPPSPLFILLVFVWKPNKTLPPSPPTTNPPTPPPTTTRPFRVFGEVPRPGPCHEEGQSLDAGPGRLLQAPGQGEAERLGPLKEPHGRFAFWLVGLGLGLVEIGLGWIGLGLRLGWVGWIGLGLRLGWLGWVGLEVGLVGFGWGYIVGGTFGGPDCGAPGRERPRAEVYFLRAMVSF